MEVEQLQMELSLPLPHRRPRRGARRRPILDTRVAPLLDRLRHDRLALRMTLCAVVAVPLLGGGWMWMRNSSLVAVRHVHITGVHGVDAIPIREALDTAAARMTTMNFNVGALRSAVSSFAIVGALHATTSFPHTVSISVSERPPVAALLSAGQRTAVAADGTVLGPALLSSSLPTVSGSVEPPAGGRLGEAAAVEAVTVLGSAPAAIAPFVARVFNGPEGLTVAMRGGLLAYFGNSIRPHAKWLSLARVLTSPSAAGASYVDVRLPERPAAGFSSRPSSSSTIPSSSSSSSVQGSALSETAAPNPTAAALAASLEKAAGGSATPSSGGTTTSGSGENESSSGSSTSSSSHESEASLGSSTTSHSSESETAAGSGEAAESPSG